MDLIPSRSCALPPRSSFKTERLTPLMLDNRAQMSVLSADCPQLSSYLPPKKHTLAWGMTGWRGNLKAQPPCPIMGQVKWVNIASRFPWVSCSVVMTALWPSFNSIHFLGLPFLHTYCFQQHSSVNSLHMSVFRICFPGNPTYCNCYWKWLRKEILRWNFGSISHTACLAMRTPSWQQMEYWYSR